jgi:hypothetical protein
MTSASAPWRLCPASTSLREQGRPTQADQRQPEGEQRRRACPGEWQLTTGGTARDRRGGATHSGRRGGLPAVLVAPEVEVPPVVVVPEVLVVAPEVVLMGAGTQPVTQNTLC